MADAQVSVILVSDYEGGSKTWENERLVLEALAAQDIGEPFDVLMVEHGAARATVPADLLTMCPRSRIVFHDDERSAALKDFGVGQVSTEFVAVFESDCVPTRSWLRLTLDALRQRPAFGVVSGYTTYGGDTAYKRCMSAIDRGFLDGVVGAETRHVSNNGAMYRRGVLVTHPHADAASPFLSNRLRSTAMAAAGIRFWFEPNALMTHAIGGLGFIRDFRYHTAYSDLKEAAMRGGMSVGGVIRKRVLWDLRGIRSSRHRYSVMDIPLLAVLFVVASASYVSGLLTALRDSRPAESSYR